MLSLQMDLAHWNGRFLMWCLCKRPAWAMAQDLRGWPKQIRPMAQA